MGENHANTVQLSETVPIRKNSFLVALVRAIKRNEHAENYSRPRYFFIRAQTILSEPRD